jgi:hypothetical protein
LGGWAPPRLIVDLYDANDIWIESVVHHNRCCDRIHIRVRVREVATTCGGVVA